MLHTDSDMVVIGTIAAGVLKVNNCDLCFNALETMPYTVFTKINTFCICSRCMHSMLKAAAINELFDLDKGSYSHELEEEVLF
jgi:hypothetical protein